MYKKSIFSSSSSKNIIAAKNKQITKKTQTFLFHYCCPNSSRNDQLGKK